MKLTYFQLETHLNRTLSETYIVSGDELLLKQEACHLIRKKAQLNGFTQRIHCSPQAGFDWEQLYSILNSSSLLIEKQIIELDFRETLPNKVASQILSDYAKKISDTNILLIDIGKIDAKISKSAWYQALEKVATVVAIWPIPREQLPTWLINRAKKYKMQLSMDVANFIVDYVEGNLTAAAQAIEKLYLYLNEKPIDKELIKNILSDESHFNIFDLIENIIAGDEKRILHILETLKQEGTEPTIILWGLMREVRQLSEMANEIEKGTSIDSLFQKYRIFSKKQSAYRKYLKEHSKENYWDLLSQGAETDRIIKGSVPGNIWDNLQLLCLRMV